MTSAKIISASCKLAPCTHGHRTEYGCGTVDAEGNDSSFDFLSPLKCIPLHESLPSFPYVNGLGASTINQSLLSRAAGRGYLFLLGNKMHACVTDCMSAAKLAAHITFSVPSPPCPNSPSPLSLMHP